MDPRDFEYALTDDQEVEAMERGLVECYQIAPECDGDAMMCVDGRLWLCWTCYVALARNEMRVNADEGTGPGDPNG